MMDSVDQQIEQDTNTERKPEAESLRYFATIRVPRELYPTFEQFENILQQEHDESGRHPICDTSRDGFMTADDKIKLLKLWDWFLENQQ